MSLLRSISCIVNNNKKNKERMGENTSGSNKDKDKLWKTFSEAVQDEQEFLRKYFASQEQMKLTSVSTKEDGMKKEEKGRKKAVMSRSESLNIIDIYDRAMAKLPKIATNKRENLISSEKKEENAGWKVARCYEVPPEFHKEIYYNSEFEDQPEPNNHQSGHLPSIHNRPLPPIPQ